MAYDFLNDQRRGRAAGALNPLSRQSYSPDNNILGQQNEFSRDN